MNDDPKLDQAAAQAYIDARKDATKTALAYFDDILVLRKDITFEELSKARAHVAHDLSNFEDGVARDSRYHIGRAAAYDSARAAMKGLLAHAAKGHRAPSIHEIESLMHSFERLSILALRGADKV